MFEYKIVKQGTCGNMDDVDADDMLSPLGGCYGTSEDVGLGAFDYEFTVEVTHGETKRFVVIFQPMERYDGMRSYSGYEMTTGAQYGHDGDQSTELIAFCDGDTKIVDDLNMLADQVAKERLAQLTSGDAPAYAPGQA
jgi:hypothetical protein